MTDFAQERSGMRSRGPSLPKLNFPSASQFLQQQHYSAPQHPFDTTQASDAGIDIDFDMDMDFDTTPVPDDKNDTSSSRPFVSAHPSPDVSDESDCERTLGRVNESTAVASSADLFDSCSSVPSSAKQLARDHARRRQSQIESQIEPPLSHDIFLAPVPIPSSSRTPPHSPFSYGKHSSFSMNTPPGSASSVMPTPCSDSAAVDALIREHVHANMLTHTTDDAFFWHLGKLSEFSFSDRFVRSRVFEIKESAVAPVVTSPPGSVDAVSTPESANQPRTSSWRLRIYPHGRGDRHRDSDYVGLYLHQEAVRAINRRESAVITQAPIANFSSSAPTPFFARGSISSTPRRSISGASILPPVRRHVTLFIATEKGDCLAKQDLVEWFSGSEGGLGFPRIVSRKTVQDAVKTSSIIDDEEDERELGIVAGVLFHSL